MITKRTQLAYLGQQINPSSPQAQGLMGFWPLNDGAGLVARDLMGRSHGTLVNGPTRTTGKFGGALRFTSGSTRPHVLLPNTASLAGATQATYSIWIKPFSWATTNTQFIAFERTSGVANETRLGLLISSAGAIIWACRDSANDPSGSLVSLSQTGANPLTLNQWSHIVGVYNSVSDNHALYINGILAASSTTAVSALGTSTSSGITVGGSNLSTTALEQFINASVFDFRIYNRALSAAEVKDIYVNPLGIYQPIYKQIYFPETAPSSPYTRMLMGVGL